MRAETVHRSTLGGHRRVQRGGSLRPRGRLLEVPLPHPADIAVDAATGALWGAYGVSPPAEPGIFRVQVPRRAGC